MNTHGDQKHAQKHDKKHDEKHASSYNPLKICFHYVLKVEKPILLYKICSVNYSSRTVNTLTNMAQLCSVKQSKIFNERCSHFYFPTYDEI